MAYLAIIINAPNDSIGELNAKAQLPTKVSDEINALIDYLSSIAAGARAASIQVVSRDTDPSVTTSGTDSQSNVYNHL